MSTHKKKRQSHYINLDNPNPQKKRKLSCSNQIQTANDKENTLPTAINKDDNDDDECFEDNNNSDDWDDLGELNYGQEILTIKQLDPQEKLQRDLEKRRIQNSSKDKFWECGKCHFLNHPSIAQCLSCFMPEMDIIRYSLNCIEPLKKCDKCYSFIIPKHFDDHHFDCDPILIDKQSRHSIKNQWHCNLTTSEKNAVCHVTNVAFSESQKDKETDKLLSMIRSINKESQLLFGEEDEEPLILDKVLSFLEWKVPITIRVHCKQLIPQLLDDTHYKNLFQTGYGSGNIDQKVRKREETKMFGDVYFGADADERPKYGCLNINLKDEGCRLAHQYGDGYFVMNDTTVRWRVTMTIKDSFAVNGNCGTLKHCKHLLNELEKDELKEIMYVAIHGKCDDKSKQKAYREIQIHGKIQLDRDIYSFHVPNNSKNKSEEKMYQLFCKKNGIKLVWF